MSTYSPLPVRGIRVFLLRITTQRVHLLVMFNIDMCYLTYRKARG